MLLGSSFQLSQESSLAVSRYRGRVLQPGTQPLSAARLPEEKGCGTRFLLRLAPRPAHSQFRRSAGILHRA